MFLSRDSIHLFSIVMLSYLLLCVLLFPNFIYKKNIFYYVDFWHYLYCLNSLSLFSTYQLSCRVGRQVVNIPSFMVRVDSAKHIDFSLTSPFGGGRPGRVKRKNQKAAAKKAAGGDGDEDLDEEWPTMHCYVVASTCLNYVSSLLRFFEVATHKFILND